MKWLCCGPGEEVYEKNTYPFIPKIHVAQRSRQCSTQNSRHAMRRTACDLTKDTHLTKTDRKSTGKNGPGDHQARVQNTWSSEPLPDLTIHLSKTLDPHVTWKPLSSEYRQSVKLIYEIRCIAKVPFIKKSFKILHVYYCWLSGGKGAKKRHSHGNLVKLCLTEGLL
jgi:hypothetical protein